MIKEKQIIHAPVNLGLRRHLDGRERGCNKLPDKLEELGFHTSIGAKVASRLTQPIYPEGQIFHDGALNVYQIATLSVELADNVEKVLNGFAFPIVLGGDCSVLIGSALALARKGKYGLIHLDAHSDYNHKGISKEAAVAGMDLALVTGKGTNILTNLENKKPYIQTENALTFGYRESDPESWIIDEVIADGITCWSAEKSTREGIEKSTDEILNFMHRDNEIEGYWLHLDADILDASIMPCVDCPEPNGLQWTELKELLSKVLASPKIVGMNVTILDPDLDVKNEVTKTFSNMLIEVLN
ncbi:arginase family protein [Chengkuizengella axinellae]|uniref:Arginase family protein n=1 Tax=Chengkuizengella axinellae TaxID=3064388 RepID=A0ABT9IX27_9BACL|nr:arginase family protein [Chengkuizengella sp. 2205SS18-9]MDP5273926.1 arginase family protein [Chengkuizengella sp. 2205SS18-9]